MIVCLTTWWVTEVAINQSTHFVPRRSRHPAEIQRFHCCPRRIKAGQYLLCVPQRAQKYIGTAAVSPKMTLAWRWNRKHAKKQAAQTTSTTAVSPSSVNRWRAVVQQNGQVPRKRTHTYILYPVSVDCVISQIVDELPPGTTPHLWRQGGSCA